MNTKKNNSTKQSTQPKHSTKKIKKSISKENKEKTKEENNKEDTKNIKKNNYDIDIPVYKRKNINKDNKNNKSTRDNKENKNNKSTRDNKENKNNKENKENKENKNNRDSRDNKFNRDNKDNRDNRDNKFNRDNKDNRDNRDNKSNRDNKKNNNSFVKQAAILATASLLVRVLGFLYRLPLTNMLGDEGNGIYSAGYNLYNMFLVISSAGLPVAISKIVAEKISLGEYKNAKKIFSVALCLSSVVGCFFSLIMFLFAEQFCNFIGSPDSYYAILTLSPTIFIVAIMSVFRGYFQGLGTTTPTALSQVVEQIFNAGFSIYLAYILVGTSIAHGAAGGTAGTGIGALAGLIYIACHYAINKDSINKRMSLKTHQYNIDSEKTIVLNIIKTAGPIIAGTAIFSMTNLIDMKMVNERLLASEAFTSNEINALYGQLTGKYVTITTLPVSISTALAMATMPSIATSIVQNDMRTVRKKIDVSLRLTMIISIPAAVGIGVLADPILKFLFPSASEGGILLKFGSVSILFLALCQILTGILQGIGKLSTPAISAFIGCLIKIPINYYLIVNPNINVVGAIVSTTACYIVASFLNLLALKKATKIRPDYKGIFIKPMVASVVMGVSCNLSYNLINNPTQNNSLAVILTILVGIIVYGLVFALIGGIRKEDVQLLPMGNRLVKILK